VKNPCACILDYSISDFFFSTGKVMEGAGQAPQEAKSFESMDDEVIFPYILRVLCR
jgi:hypothetical protein